MNVINTSDSEVVADFLTKRILEQLAQGKKVLWIVPGGSSITAAAIASQEISKHPHKNLIVTLTDERYGPVGHVDSNWKQLTDKGFTLPQAQLIPVLTGEDRQTTTRNRAKALRKAIDDADYIIGFFGIGADGHIAGLLPHTPPLTSPELADSYKAEKFERISITPHVIDQLDEAVAFAVGEGKWPTLKRLNDDVSVIEQPAQLLKRIPDFTLFTDCSMMGLS